MIWLSCGTGLDRQTRSVSPGALHRKDGKSCRVTRPCGRGKIPGKLCLTP